MGRGSSSSSRGSSSSSSRGSSSSGRGFSSSGRSSSSWGSSGHRHTTIFIGGGGGIDGASRTPVKIISILVGVFLVLAGLSFAIMVINSILNGFEYNSTTGVCVNNDYEDSYYYTTYRYTVDGINYENESEVGWEKPEELNKSVEIWYLKSDPNVITDENPGFILESDGISIIASLAFIGFGVLFIVLASKKKPEEEKSKSKSNNNDYDYDYDEDYEETVKYVECLYCGGKYKQEEKSCPFCGANKQK